MIPRGNNFRLTISTKDLKRGLRPSKRSPRNSGYLIRCAGCVGRDGVLQVLDSMTALDLDVITDPFPYPQLFVLPSMIIVCGLTTIYEWVSGALVSKLTVTAGSTWSVVASGEYAYMSNGKVSVVRDAFSGVYTVSDLPIASCICNYNGQILIGSPEEDSS